MKTYAQPLLLWLVVLVGLVVALVSDGVLESLATAACALPLLVIALRLRGGLRSVTEKDRP